MNKDKPIYERYRHLTIIGMVVSIGSFISFAVGIFSSSFSILPIAFIGFPLGAILAGYFLIKYKNAVKDIYVLKTYKEYFDNVHYDQKAAGMSYDIRNLELFQVGSTLTVNDLITGEYHGVRFSQFDASSSTTTGSGDDRSTTYHFVGQVYAFDFIKKTNSTHRLVSTKRFSQFGKSKTKGVQSITFEDERFNKAFKSYSNDELEAFYIFTPHFMERMMSLSNKLNVGFTVVIKESTLFLSLYTNKDSHEPKLFGKIDERYLAEINQSISLIEEIVDELELLNTYFKRENDN